MSLQYICYLVAFLQIYIRCQHVLVESIVSGRGEEGAGSTQAHYWLPPLFSGEDVVKESWMQKLVLQSLFRRLFVLFRFS